MSVIALLFLGPTIFEKLQIQTPAIVNSLLEKKFMVMMAAFVLGNMIKNQLLATGAFEIYFDDELVFSKLQSKQAPSQEILENLFRMHNVI